MFYFWREATAALVPGFLCQSSRRRPENVSILSSLILSWDGDQGPVLTVLWRAVVLSPVLDLKVPNNSTVLEYFVYVVYV